MLSHWIMRFAGISTICLAVCAGAKLRESRLVRVIVNSGVPKHSKC
jgi:hypothetical protein